MTSRESIAPQRPLLQRLAGFGLAGVTGLAVDAAVLALLLAATPLGPFLSRVIAIAVALSVTFAINRTLAFGPSGRGVAVEGARYGGVGLAGAALNYAIYSALLLVAPTIPALAALFVASALVTVFSWFGYSRLVFAR